jgi:hypothetical protein
MLLRLNTIAALLITGTLGSAAVAAAQPAAPAAAQPAGAQGGSAQGGSAPVDVSRLPLDLDRIQRKLRQTTIREESDGPLRLRYVVDVYGIAPRIELFTEKDNLVFGQVPFGAPTHRDMLEMMTPQEFRSPAADFGALARWLADKASKGDKKK